MATHAAVGAGGDTFYVHYIFEFDISKIQQCPSLTVDWSVTWQASSPPD